LIHGSFKRRRRHVRRAGDRNIASIDWHHPQWLAVAMLILLLCTTDALLTLTLLNLGAQEINPFMKPLVTGSGPAFAIWKMGLTSGGVIMLTILARLRAFGVLPIGALLYVVLALYVILVVYELWLLEQLLMLHG
jgi:hypothetical protein